MEILRVDVSLAEPIAEYDSKLAASVKLTEGGGEAHAFLVYFEPGGEIGPHEAGFG
jgi:hypothetical protein